MKSLSFVSIARNYNAKEGEPKFNGSAMFNTPTGTLTHKISAEVMLQFEALIEQEYTNILGQTVKALREELTPLIDHEETPY